MTSLNRITENAPSVFARFFAFSQKAMLVASIVCFALALPVRSSSQEAAPKPPPLRAGALGARPEFNSLRRTIVPFSYDPPTQPYITVQASVNGSRPLTFVVDTGLGIPLYVRSWAAKELGLKASGEIVTVNPGDLHFNIVQYCTLDLIAQPPGPKVPFQLNRGTALGEIPLIEALYDNNIAGVLGGALFFFNPSRIDFDTKTLTFFAGPHAPYKPVGLSVTLPLMRNTTQGVRPYTRWNLPGMEACDFLIDTGSTATDVPAANAKQLPRLDTTSILRSDLPRTYSESEVLLPPVNIGSLQSSLLCIALTSKSDAALGIDFLSRFRITLDPDNDQLILEARSVTKQHLPAKYELVLEVRHDTLSIKNVDPVAAQAGGAVGDVLKSIDGKSTKDSTTLAAMMRLLHYTGTKVTVEVEKPDHRIVTVQWITQGGFPHVVAGPIGLTLLKPDGKNALVLDVEDGSEAEKAGIVLEDELLSINGKKTNKLTPQTLADELESSSGAKGSLVLTFRRKKDNTEYTLKVENGKLLTPIPDTNKEPTSAQA